MSDGTYDDTKGRVKQAAGDLTGDDELRNEGRIDRASGSIKDKLGQLTGRVKDALRRDR